MKSLALVLCALVIGCTNQGAEKGNAILSHCADTSYTNGVEVGTYKDTHGQYNDSLFEKCVNDSLFVLDKIVE